MGAKQGGKGGGKKKGTAPAYDTSPEALAAFGLAVGELVRTPLGLSGRVLGVRREEPGAPESARVWVRYDGGHEAPLEPRQAAGALNALGYRPCGEADAIRAAVAVQEAEAARAEDERQRAAEVARLLAAGEPLPSHLLPPGGTGGGKEGGKKEGAKGKEGGGKGDKKKVK